MSTNEFIASIALLDRANAENDSLRKRVAEITSAFDGMRSLCTTVRGELVEQRARAEHAEAALAIVQSKGGLKEKVALLASENGCLRAELSQTKRDLKDWQDSSEAYRHDAEKAEADCKRAEAECKAMRELCEMSSKHLSIIADLEKRVEGADEKWSNMVDVAKANGFDSLTDAITQAVRAKKRIVELEKKIEFVEACLGRQRQSIRELQGQEEIKRGLTLNEYGWWVFAVAEPYTAGRIKAAWWVLTGRAVAFKVPESGELEAIIGHQWRANPYKEMT